MIKKANYGSFIRELNDVSTMANSIINAHLSGVEPLQSIDVLSKVSYEDAMNCLLTRLDLDKSVLSIIE